MGYRWKSKTDVDETVVVIMNSLDEQEMLPQWLMRTIQTSIDDSDPGYVKYFYEELEKYAPQALKIFEDLGGAD
jgi:hypothetical protein